MGFISWESVKRPSDLIEALKRFLEHVFGKELLLRELENLERYRPKRGHETLKFLIDVNVHRAARWYRILQDVAGRNYVFALNYMLEAEEFMHLMLFAYAFDKLLQLGKASLQDNNLIGRLKDRRGFESLMYEILIASNYAENGFDVDIFPKAGDVFAKKNSLEVYIECKRLRRESAYNELAVKVGSWLIERKLNLLVDVELTKTPKSRDVESISNAIREHIEGRKIERNIKIRYHPLPEYLRDPLTLYVENPESIEYVAITSYFRLSEEGVEVKEPKVLIFRNVGRYSELVTKINNALEEAYDQLKAVESARKVICLDVTEVVGRPVLQLPDLIRLDVGAEILISKLEEYVRSWLVNHTAVDAIILTSAKLYFDAIGFPFATVVENKTIAGYVAPGWTISTRMIPMLKDYSPEQLVNLGLHLKELGLYQLSEFYFRKALDEKPCLKEAYNNLGRLLTDLGRIEEALQYLDKAIELDPNYTSALINKGIALAKLWRFNEALEYFKKVASIKPDEPKAYYNIAVIYEMMGDIANALHYVEEALALNANYELAIRLKNFLEKVRKSSTSN